jgi:uncharacterized protein YoaH (UPF0181 family)
MKTAEVERIAGLLAEGMSPSDIAAQLNDEEIDSLAAADEDDSDEAIERGYGISVDDRFDSRGEALLPRLNEAGEPNWW